MTEAAGPNTPRLCRNVVPTTSRGFWPACGQEPVGQHGPSVAQAVVAVQRVSDEDQGQRRHDPADAAASRLEDQHQADESQPDIRPGLDSGPVSQRPAARPEMLERRLRLHHDIGAGGRRREAEQQVQAAQPAVRGEPGVDRKSEEAEQQSRADKHCQGRLRQQRAVVHLEQHEEAEGHSQRPDQGTPNALYPLRAEARVRGSVRDSPLGLVRLAQPASSGQTPISR